MNNHLKKKKKKLFDIPKVKNGLAGDCRLHFLKQPVYTKFVIIF